MPVPRLLNHDLHLRIEYISIETIKPFGCNPRAHSEKQIGQITTSISAFGLTSPLTVDGEGRLIIGEGKLKALKLLGHAVVPVVRIEHLSEAELKTLRIADNRLAELGGWDEQILRIEYQEILALEPDFDLTITGFDVQEIDGLLHATPVTSKPDPLDALPPFMPTASSRLGDVWHVGPHMLICGDSLKDETYAVLLGDHRAAMVFSDPPYNVPIAGHVSGLGKVAHREFAMASGEMDSTSFTRFLTDSFTLCAAWSVPGSIHFQCMDHRHLGEIIVAGDAAYRKRLNLCVWTKTNAGMGSLYRSQHELVLVFQNGGERHTNNVQLGRFGRNRTNVWTYAGANSFGPNRDAELAMHPTVKPVAMVADAILDVTRPKDIVLDPFAGSGSTLVAAHKTRRRGFGIEIDPLYCDVTLRRLQQITGVEPVHAETGLSFAEIAAQRVDSGEAAQ